MKRILLSLIITTTLSITTGAFAYDRWSNGGGCDSGNCEVSYCNDCQCTDPAYGRNTCMSNSEYCEVYGNVGGR